MAISTTRPRLPLALAVLCCGVVIAACGSSSKPAKSASGSRGIKFSDCMRSHGVPNFPDPTAGGGGISIHIGSGAGINPASPSFQAAQSACSKLLPGGGPGAGPPSEQAKAQMVAMSKCMRAHGVSGFPDPTTTAPSNPTVYGAVMGHNGVFLAIPKTINPTSPTFEQAAAVCKFPGPPGGAKRS